MGVTSSKPAPAASRVTRAAVTSPPRSPKVTRRCSRRSLSQAGSSAFTTSRPSGARYCTSFEGFMVVEVIARQVGEDGGAELESLQDRKSTRLNSSHLVISYAVFCLKKKKKK